MRESTSRVESNRARRAAIATHHSRLFITTYIYTLIRIHRQSKREREREREREALFCRRWLYVCVLGFLTRSLQMQMSLCRSPHFRFSLSLSRSVVHTCLNILCGTQLTTTITSSRTSNYRVLISTTQPTRQSM